MENRYYWLRLKDDFFSSKRIKKLRTLKKGDTFLIIYLKIQLLAVRTQGVLEFTGLESTFAEELALDIDEPLKDVEATLDYLEKTNLITTEDGGQTWVLPFVVDNTGTEGSSAARVRKHRDKALHCNTDVTGKALHCNTDVTDPALHCYGEKEIEKEIEIDIEGDIDKHREAPPTLTDVITYCSEAGLSNMDPEKFYDHFSAKGWKTVADWKARARIWDREDAEKNQPKQSELDRIWEKVTHDKGGV